MQRNNTLLLKTVFTFLGNHVGPYFIKIENHCASLVISKEILGFNCMQFQVHCNELSLKQ